MRDKRLKQRLEYSFLRTVQAIVNVLPASWAVAVGTPLGTAGYWLWKTRRDIAHANLAFCFPERERAWVRRVARRSFVNFVKAVIDFMRLPRLNTGNIERYNAIVNQKCFDDAVAAGKGGLLFTGHFGSWEQSGAGIGLRGYPIHFLVGWQSNRLVDAEMNRLREAPGIGIIHVGTAVKSVFRVLKGNAMVAILSDQDAGPEGVVVQFFGRRASTPKGPAAFVLKTGATVCAGFAVRDNNTHNTLYMEDAYREEGTGDAEEDIRRVTQRYTWLLEKYVRAYPDHYHWMHRRFKTTYPALYERGGRTAP